MERIAQALRALAGADLAAHVASTVSTDFPGIQALYDLDEEAHRVCGVDSPTLLLVRPDGHVAVGTSAEPRPLLEPARRWSVPGWPRFLGSGATLAGAAAG